MDIYKILIVDDEVQNREYLSEVLAPLGYEIGYAANGKDALKKISEGVYHIVVTDLYMPEMDGLEVIRYISDNKLSCIGILYTGYGSIATAVEAMKMGAFDYIAKPFRVDEIRVVIEKAVAHLKLKEENIQLKSQLRSRYGFDNIVGNSEKMQKLFSMVEKIAPTESTVLILGESGTGKELIARAIHYNSPRTQYSFVAVNCGAIPEELLESELFGHEKGAFTGAFRTKIGKFELAQGGSIFLDEISEMSPGLQVKLLRVLQEREFERVGGVHSINADVRVIAATNKDLDEEVKKGRFREDLFYRLNVIPIALPPLRERKEDIPLLIKHFLSRSESNKQGKIKGFSKEAMEALAKYRWPGNVREMENLVERVVALCESPVVDVHDLPEKILGGSFDVASISQIELPEAGIDMPTAVDEFEKTLIIQALNRSNWVKNKAAQLLRLNRTTLVEKIKKQGIKPPAENAAREV